MKTYQVALSFAGEQRNYVDRVAQTLQARGIPVFYDQFETFRIWGKDGAEFFNQIYSHDADCVVMFISAEYIAKKWTRLERRAALSRAMQEKEEFILPVRFDDTPVPGLPDTVQYLRAEAHTPEVLAAAICEKLGIPVFAGKASAVPPPRMTSNTGEAVFDYSSFNGRYIIGNGLLLFETMWSKASDVSIHLYNDPDSINGIAIATAARSIGDIHDASSYDFSSRTRTPREGDIVILRNTKGFYAALRIIEIMDSNRTDYRDELRFEYAIQPNGSGSFEEFTSQKESR